MVPPYFVVRMESHLDQKVQEQIIVESGIWKDLLVLRTLHDPKVSLLICLMNVSDRELLINQGQILTQAAEVYCCAAESPSKAQSGDLLGDIPPHLGNLDRSSKSLQGEDVDMLKLLLIQFEDVFA